MLRGRGGVGVALLGCCWYIYILSFNRYIKLKRGLILKELEARRYINKSTWLQSFLYDMDLLPEQLDKPGKDFNRMLLIVDLWERNQKRISELEFRIKSKNKILELKIKKEVSNYEP